MATHIEEHGSNYWVIRHPTSIAHLLALAKVTPQADTEGRPGLYINDVLSTVEGWGYGSTVLHAALSPYPAETPVTLDGFEGSDVNQWFEDMGLQPGEVTAGGYKIGRYALNQVAYAGASVGDMRGYMQSRHPELQHFVSNDQLPPRTP
jgi:hypothetical protein